MGMYWAKPELVREQAVLFPTRLDDVIAFDHEVRMLHAGNQAVRNVWSLRW